MLNYTYRFLGGGPVYILFSLGIILFESIAEWMMYVKAGEPGWKSLIPLYSEYTYMKIAWRAEMFWLELGFVIAARLISLLGRGDFTVLGIGYLLSIPAIIIGFKANIEIAHRFGKSTAFGILLLGFLPVVGIAILGYGDAVYHPYVEEPVVSEEVTRLLAAAEEQREKKEI